MYEKSLFIVEYNVDDVDVVTGDQEVSIIRRDRVKNMMKVYNKCPSIHTTFETLGVTF